MGKRRLLAALVSGILGLVCQSANANLVTLSLDWNPDVAVSSGSTVNWAFDLSSLGLDAPGTVINSASLNVSASGVDTNANIPAGGYYERGRSSTWVWYEVDYVSGNLSDTLQAEGNAAATLGGSGDNVWQLQPGATNDFAYLLDGSFSVQLLVNETNNWNWTYLGRNIYGPYSGVTYYYDYYNWTPAYDGQLTLLNTQLTIDYTPPAAIPEPISMAMLGCLGAGMAAARKLRGKSKA